ASEAASIQIGACFSPGPRLPNDMPPYYGRPLHNARKKIELHPGLLAGLLYGGKSLSSCRKAGRFSCGRFSARPLAVRPAGESATGFSARTMHQPSVAG